MGSSLCKLLYGTKKPDGAYQVIRPSLPLFGMQRDVWYLVQRGERSVDLAYVQPYAQMGRSLTVSERDLRRAIEDKDILVIQNNVNR